MATLTASILIIGNEILSGRTQDKNIAYLGQNLSAMGIQLREVRIVRDIESEIVKAVNELRAECTYLFTTGGIGPTHDDITSASIARAFGVALIRHPDAERALRAHYTTDQINEARLKMADVPDGATLIPNAVSTAPGFKIDNVYVMAGVPKIMQAMFDALKPQLQTGAAITSASVTINLAEGAIAQGLADIQARYPDIDIGSYPYYREGGFYTTLVMRSADPTRNESAATEVRAMVKALGGLEIPLPEVA
jgi:molybdenum cofactor synthesis domain-containing protein